MNSPIRTKWPGTMTDRERFNAIMHYQPADRCFNMEFGYWQENFSAWSIFRDNGITNNDEADAFFGFDRMASIGTNLWLSPPFEHSVVEDRGTTQILRNGDGLLAEVPKDQHGTIPHYIDATVKTPDDWQATKRERFRLDDPARVPDIPALQTHHPDTRDYPLGIHCGSLIGKIRDMLTFEGICYAQYDYPDMLEDMVETCCLLVEQSLDRLLPYFTFDFASGWEDICYKSGPIVSLDFFERVLVPRYQRIGRKLADAGIDIWFTDCDGDVRPLLPGFLSAGLNTLFPFEVNCSGHPAAVLDRHGRELRLLGGVDKLELGRDRAAIATYLESLRPLVARGGVIPFCDHRCPPNVDEQDYLYYLDLKRELFGKEQP